MTLQEGMRLACPIFVFPYFVQWIVLYEQAGYIPLGSTRVLPERYTVRYDPVSKNSTRGPLRRRAPYASLNIDLQTEVPSIWKHGAQHQGPGVMEHQTNKAKDTNAGKRKLKITTVKALKVPRIDMRPMKASWTSDRVPGPCTKCDDANTVRRGIQPNHLIGHPEIVSIPTLEEVIGG